MTGKDWDEQRERLKEQLREATLKPKESLIFPTIENLMKQEEHSLLRLLGRIEKKVEDEDEREKKERKAVRLHAEAKRRTLDKWYKDFEKHFKGKGDWEAYKWMTNDPEINYMLQTTQFEKVNGIFRASTLSRDKCLEVMDRYGVGYIIEMNKRKGVMEQRVPVLLEELDYGRINRKLKLSAMSHTIYKYIREFKKARLLREVGKRGERGQNIYAMGTWVEFGYDSFGNEQFRRNFFLKNTPEMRKSLRKFKVRK